MLSGIRKAINSKVGLIITFVALGVIALAFALSDINMTAPGGTTAQASGQVAQVGNIAITEQSLQERMRNAVETLRRENPTLTMSQFVAQGGLDQVLEQMINGIALEQFGLETGLAVSQRYVDGQIASIPAFQGFDGQFNQQQFEQALAQQGITPDMLREDIRRETISNWLTAPTLGARQVPAQVALPYASLLLERRAGSVAFVQTKSMDPGTAPTDAQLQQYYAQNRARYTVAERRTARYATISTESVADRATPTDAEIQQLYVQERARFAATEQRTIRQVVALDRNIASQIAGKVRGGTSIDAAASAAGLSATTVSDVNKLAYAGQTDAAVADAAFGAAQNAVVGPVQGAGSFYVVQVTGVEQIAGRSLDQVRGELTETLTAQKTAQALAELQDRIDDSINDGSTFDETVSQLGLQPQRTEALFVNGRTLGQPADAAVSPIVRSVAEAVFGFEEGDQPQMVPVGEAGAFALVALAGIQPAAPRPLAEIRAGVAGDYRIDNAKRQASARADAILRAVNGGASLAQAAVSGGVAAQVQPLSAQRGELGQAQDNVPLQTLFNLRRGTARVVEAPGNAGFFVVQLTQVQPGNARGNAQLLGGTRQALGQIVGQEYAQQFAQAVRRRVGTTRNDASVQNLRNTLTGTVPN